MSPFGRSPLPPKWVMSFMDGPVCEIKICMYIYFQATILHRDEAKGMLNSAALVDINGDNIRDIVIATFNSTVLAIDGSNFKTIWNVTFPNSESYSNIGKIFFG